MGKTKFCVCAHVCVSRVCAHVHRNCLRLAVSPLTPTISSWYAIMICVVCVCVCVVNEVFILFNHDEVEARTISKNKSK